MPNSNRLSDPVAGLTEVLHQLEQDQRETRTARLPEAGRRAGQGGRNVFARALVPVLVAGLIAAIASLALPHLLRDDHSQNFNTTGRSLPVEAEEVTRLRDALANAEAVQQDLQIELNIARQELRSRGTVTPWHADVEMLTYRSPWTR